MPRGDAASRHDMLNCNLATATVATHHMEESRQPNRVIGDLGSHVLDIVEFGAGSLRKVGLLLGAFEAPARYLPIDISGDHLRDAAATGHTRDDGHRGGHCRSSTRSPRSR